MLYFCATANALSPELFNLPAKRLFIMSTNSSTVLALYRFSPCVKFSWNTGMSLTIILVLVAAASNTGIPSVSSFVGNKYKSHAFNASRIISCST